MKKNIATLTILPIEASTSAVFARGDTYESHAGYENDCNTTPRRYRSPDDRTMLKSFSKKSRVYGILIAFLFAPLLSGCYMHPSSGVGIYVPPVGVSVHAPPLHYGRPYHRPHHRPHHWRRHRPRHWH